MKTITLFEQKFTLVELLKIGGLILSAGYFFCWAVTGLGMIAAVVGHHPGDLAIWWIKIHKTNPVLFTMVGVFVISYLSIFVKNENRKKDVYQKYPSLNK